MDRFLILSASPRKRLDPGLMPAIERYDGPAFRVLRRYLRGQPADPPRVYILSAAFGLISADEPIPHYDRRMTCERARELQLSVGASLRRLLVDRPVAAIDADRVLVVLGKDYLTALAGYPGNGAAALEARVAPGGQGGKLAVLRRWLYGDAPSEVARRGTAGRTRPVRLRGIELTLTGDEVLDFARRALRAGADGAGRYQSWYVEVDGQRVGPKWLVSRLTDLPVTAFTTSEARRVLTGLGVEVRRP